MEKMQDKISIIIAVYNAEKYLDKCLKSILSQMYNNIEIIAVNDGSTDKSLEILQKYEKQNKNIKIYNQKNSGQSVARNLAIKNATGKYILICDSDDYLEKDLIPKLAKYIEKSYDIVKFKMTKVDTNGNKLEEYNVPNIDNITGQELFNTICFIDKMLDSPTTYLYKKELFEKNNLYYPEGKSHEDFALTSLLILNAKKAASTNICGYNYVMTKNSSTRGYYKEYKRAIDILSHYDNLFVYLKNNLKQIDNKTRENLIIYYTNNLLNTAKILNKEDKKQYIKELKKRKISKNIKCRNLKQILKKILLKIDINSYLRLMNK